MKRTSLLLASVVLALAALPTTGAAKDAVAASATPIPEPTPLVFNNGNAYSNGTYAIGTIQLFYTVNAFTFTPGAFASFDLGLGVKVGPTSGQQTRYPVNVTLDQIGSQNILLAPDDDTFTVTGQTWTDHTTVHISISAAAAANVTCDGCDLVGNLRIVAAGGSHLDTPTNVQVHIKLVHPTSCLRVFNFITDQGFTVVPLTSAVVHLGGPQNNRRVVSTNPGQMSDNVLIINECSTDQSFNLDIVLDPHFSINGHGNKVFTYFTSSSVDPDAFDLSVFGSGTPQGTSLWLENITVPAGDSFLVRVHMSIISGNPPSWLPATAGAPPAGIFDGFWAELYVPGSAPANLATAPLAPMAVPNPASTSLGFTVQVR